MVAERADAESARKVGTSQHDEKPAKKKKKLRGRSAPANLGIDGIPVALNGDHQGKMPEFGIPTVWLVRGGTEALVDKLAEGTRESYDSAWNQWALWRQLQRESPYLTESNVTERKAN